MNDEVVIEVNAIDTKIPSTSALIIKTQYDSGKQEMGIQRVIRRNH